jgi:hypothetical protein
MEIFIYDNHMPKEVKPFIAPVSHKEPETGREYWEENREWFPLNYFPWMAIFYRKEGKFFL